MFMNSREFSCQEKLFSREKCVWVEIAALNDGLWNLQQDSDDGDGEGDGDTKSEVADEDNLYEEIPGTCQNMFLSVRYQFVYFLLCLLAVDKEAM